jgi:proline iminopeptidase
VSGPLDCAWKLHQAWPNSRLAILDDVGHGGRPLGQACADALRSVTAPISNT